MAHFSFLFHGFVYRVGDGILEDSLYIHLFSN